MELEKEQFVVGKKGKIFRPLGIVTLTHREYEGFMDICKAGDHTVTDNWAWVADPAFSDLEVKSLGRVAVNQFRPMTLRSKESESHIRIRSIGVNVIGGPRQRFASSSGCLAFQVCPYGECVAMKPPCGSAGQQGTFSDVPLGNALY